MSVSLVPASDSLAEPLTREFGVSSRPVPAWLLSLMLHFGLVLSGALLLRAGALTGSGQGGGDRGGEIVLYAGTSDTKQNYLTEQDVGGSGSEEPTITDLDTSTDAQPTTDAAPMIPGSGLPKAVSSTGAAKASTSAISATGATRRLGPTGGKGGSAATAVFGTIGEGQRFVYVFDRSSSMRATNTERDPFNAAKRELLASLANLGDIHQFGIVFYNHEQTIFGSATGSGVRMYFAKKENRILAERFVSATGAQGATKHLPALKLALEARPDVIFFLTDADDPVLTEEDLRKLKGWNAGTAINAIQFGYGPKQTSDSLLEILTSENGGMYRYVDVQQLPRAR
jgi:hypothetical protein